MSQYREKALAEYGETCQGCGTEENILVHHRNGDRSDNRIQNLIPLCTTCHGKVHGRSDEFEELVRELGYKPRKTSHRIMELSKRIADELFDRKQRGESYEDVIWRLIEQAEDADETRSENHG